jgi:DNA-binding transcriptional ArsR family regulator
MRVVVDMARLRPAAEEAAALLRTLGNSDRLLLMCELSQGELCVTDLAERTGIVQPTLSQQLGVLRGQRLVDTRRDGKQVYYSVVDAKALAVLKTLYRLYCGGN